MRLYLPLLMLIVSLILSACFCNKPKNEPALLETQTEETEVNTNDNSLGLEEFGPAAEALVMELLDGQWLEHFLAVNNRNPVLMISSMQNLSEDHVSVDILRREISRKLLATGKVRFVVPREDRPLGNPGQAGQSEDPMQAMADATGADFAIKGVMNRTGALGEDVRSKLYLVEISLVNLETGELVGRASYTIQKQIYR